MVTKCDLCKKEIEKEPVMAGFGFWGRAQLCKDCGSPIITFLEEKNLLKKENKKNVG